VDTLLVNEDGSPAAKRGGKRLRRGRVPEHSDVEDEFLIKPSAFDVMRKAAKKPEIQFDKNKSKAREVVDEMAVESEDEYAGLGGASDDSDCQEDELDKDMINDNSGEVVDEKELAALNAYVLRTRPFLTMAIELM
jgi:mediator of replication checkpoint protein 1